MAQSKPSLSNHSASDTQVLDQDVQEPGYYTVVLHNDDFTTQDFVVHVLISFLNLALLEAHQVMLKVHREGKARVGRFTKDIALTKVAFITSYSRKNGMPLLVTAEAE